MNDVHGPSDHLIEGALGEQVGLVKSKPVGGAREVGQELFLAKLCGCVISGKAGLLLTQKHARRRTHAKVVCNFRSVDYGFDHASRNAHSSTNIPPLKSLPFLTTCAPFLPTSLP